MKTFWLTGFLLCTVLISNSQDNEGVTPNDVVSPCHTYEMQDALFASSPSLLLEAEEHRLALEEFTRDFESSTLAKDGEILIIPVVFHIIHTNGSENISNEQVEDCIRVLNEDFNAANAELASIVSGFQDIIGDVGIEFRLAQLDPNGNCTNGIIRETSITTNSGGENLKTVSPIWDRQSYMNVWVCRSIASGAAGYTFGPFALAGSFGDSNDGIVVRSDYVGSIGTSSVSRSHTMSHEVGHWINLSHVWGPTNEPGLEGNCEIDDFVVDTPNSLGWFFCNPFGESCGEPNNVQNYMEYSGCGSMFTEGQATRMQAAINYTTAYRSSLWQPENLIETGVDAGILCSADFKSTKVPLICAGSSLFFEDLSYNDITGHQWTFEGGEPATSTELSPEITWNTPGDYTVTLTVSNANGSLDVAKVQYVRVLAAGAMSLPFTENYDSYTSLNSQAHDWTVQEAAPGTWSWELTDDASFSGSQSAFVRGRLNPENVVSNLVSPSIDLSEVPQNAVLRFKYAHARRIGDSDDELRVLASANCGETWSVRKILSGNNLPTVANNVTSQYVPESLEEWREVEVTNLVGSFLSASFLIKFEFTSYKGNNIYLDDINIVDPDMVVGVDEQSFVRSLSIFPNPGNGEVSIAFSLAKKADVTLGVFDLTGRNIEEQNEIMLPVGDHLLQISAGQLSPGTYLVVLNVNGERFSRRLVVTK